MVSKMRHHHILLLLPLLLFFNLCLRINAQQEYENNKQLDCYGTNASTTLGYACNGPLQCTSFLTFRSSAPYYQSPVQISFLFNTTTANVSSANSVPDIVPIPDGDLVLVPISCSCSGPYYQHNATYVLKFNTETYFTVANNTYQGLSTCQSLIAQNPYLSTNLSLGSPLQVPVRCACPTSNQTAAGVKYLLNYLITWGDSISAIARRFGISEQSLLNANNLTTTSTIFPFTTLLVPLQTEPTKNEIASPPPPPPMPVPPPPPPPSSSSSSKTWVYVGVGVGVGFVALAGLSLFLICCFWRRNKEQPKKLVDEPASAEAMLESGDMTDIKSSTPFISGSIRTMIESLTLYKFEELERATANFSDDCRIEGSSVYRGTINGDEAAIKRLKGDVSNEINILKQINHSSIVRLSGFCIHNGNTYLVYQFAGNGSLSEWIHGKKLDPVSGGPYCLSWKHRVQVAYDVADGLNYLHNYTKPPYVHKNLNSRNVLLDRDFRAKLSNFGLARAVNEEVYIGDSGVQPQLTRHVIGTQGYMAPEYLEHGLIMTQLDVFAFGVLLLELLSGKEPVLLSEEDMDKERDMKQPQLLSELITGVLSGEDVRSKLREFIDPCLQSDYPFDLAFAMAELAMQCVAREPGSRPGMGEVLVSLSGIYNSTFDWDPSDYGKSSGSTVIDAR
ncbi:Protein kinase [Rhynchospora pubera]|uniref:Protein kinase n=1 Tax=Rhynchospora pubera TaxID=906938 RepID=A0AAV8G0N3_9POAL|nr:Protein kinase [Rhynchospora pubera]